MKKSVVEGPIVVSCTRSTPPRTWSRVCATGGQTHKVRCWLKCRSVIYMHHRPAYRTCSSVCVCVVNIVCMFVCSFTVTASRRVAHSHFFLSTAKIYSKSIYSLLSLAGFDYNTFPLRSLAAIIVEHLAESRGVLLGRPFI